MLISLVQLIGVTLTSNPSFYFIIQYLNASNRQGVVYTSRDIH